MSQERIILVSCLIQYPYFASIFQISHDDLSLIESLYSPTTTYDAFWFTSFKLSRAILRVAVASIRHLREDVNPGISGHFPPRLLYATVRVCKFCRTSSMDSSSVHWNRAALCYLLSDITRDSSVE
jgi:hypothetical protein